MTVDEWKGITSFSSMKHLDVGILIVESDIGDMSMLIRYKLLGCCNVKGRCRCGAEDRSRRSAEELNSFETQFI